MHSVYDDDFYIWWEWKLPALEKFLYADMDFRGDPDLVPPPGGAWGELGKQFFKNFLTFFKILRNFKMIDIYIYVQVLIL